MSQTVATAPRFFRSDRIVLEETNYQVDHEAGIIRNVVMCRVGEARGHEVQLDQDFINQVARLGAAHPIGIKARFGHPNMCSEALGTYCGRFKEFRVEGERCLADFHFGESASKTPNGDLKSYILSLAAEDPDSFGCSIVFIAGDQYYTIGPDGSRTYYSSRYEAAEANQGPVFIMCKELVGCDFVDEPAATDGLFSASTLLNKDNWAVQASEMLDLFIARNPGLDAFMQSNPGRIEQFIHTYFTNRKMSKQSYTAKALAALKKLGRKVMEFDIEATTTEGQNILIITTESEPAIGDPVMVVDEEGNQSAYPDGSTVINGGDLDGYTITVAEGVISAIEAPASEEEAPAEDASTELLSANFKKLHQQFAQINARLNKIEQAPAMQKAFSGKKEDAIQNGQERELYSWEKKALQAKGK